MDSSISKFSPNRGPGLFFILLYIDKIVVVDLRTVTFDVAPQEILTKGSVTVTVGNYQKSRILANFYLFFNQRKDAVVYFRVYAPILSVINVANVQYSTRLLAATTLRNILRTKTLQEILQDREMIAGYRETHHQLSLNIFKLLFI